MRRIGKWAGALAALPLLTVVAVASPTSADTLTAAAVASTPPRIDGVLDNSEWPTQTLAFTSLDPLRGHIRLSHDRNRLYVQVNVTGDTTNNPGDIVQVWVDVNRDRAVTPGVDLEYQLFGTPSGHLFRAVMNQPGQPPTFQGIHRSSGASGFGCFFADGSWTVRFDPYQQVCNEHRVFELALDLQQIGVTLGQAVRIGVRAADNATGGQGRIPAGVGRASFGDLVDVDTEALPLRTVPAGSWSFGHTSFPVEVTQATQSQGNPEPLVAGKPTFVRVHPRATALTGATALTYPGKVLLYGERPDGTNLPGSPLLSEVQISRFPDRERLADSALFQLPASWIAAGRTRLFAHTLADNRAFLTLFNDVEFRTGRQPTIWQIPINVGSEQTPAIPTADEMAAQEDAIEAAYPVAGVSFVRRPWEDIGVYSGTTVDGVIDELQELDDRLVAAWSFNIASGRSTFVLPDQILGHAELSRGGTSDPTWNGGNGRVAAGESDGSTSRDLMFAHEINHNLDRASDNQTWGGHIGGCDAGEDDPNWPGRDNDNFSVMEVGFDARSPIGAGSVVRASENELMSYCNSSGGAQTKWISPYRWRRLAEAFRVISPSTTSSTSDSGSASTADAPEIGEAPFGNEVLYVSGRIRRDGGVSLNPIVTLPGPLTELPPDRPTAHRLQLVGAGGGVLLDVPLAAVFEEPDAEHEPREHIGFSLRLPTPAGLAGVRVTRDGTVVAERRLSPSAPSIRIVDPAPGTDVGTGRFTVGVDRFDPDGDPVTWSLYVRSATSPSTGRWLPVASGLTGDTAVVDTKSLPGGDELRLRVVASDGLRTAIHTLEGDIAAPPAPPLVGLLGPDDGQRIGHGDVVSYRTDATAADGRVLDARELVWLVDGKPAGDGPELQVALDRGRHVIEVVATDTLAGTSARARRSIIVVPACAPSGRATGAAPAGECERVVPVGR